MANSEVFPRDKYKELLTRLFPPGSTIYWTGDPVPFFEPVSAYATPIVVKVDVGDAYGYGTSERRRNWIPEAQGGQGAWQYYTLQRMTWPLLIDVETYNADHPGEDFLMIARNRLRWRSSIQAIQDMGITTIHVGNVNSEVRTSDDHETFGALLLISHGQCYSLLEDDDDGGVIETITSIPGTLTGGEPDPVLIEEGPVSVG